MDALAACHRSLGRVLGEGAEPLEVLRKADAHRQYWRPEQVRVVLLAESHVYTTTAELARRVMIPVKSPSDLPRDYVRLVYCLGYGEDLFLDQPIGANPGTPQFWQIFHACAMAPLPVPPGPLDFSPILKTRTQPAQRVANKLAAMTRMRELGVWLLDASPAALYFPGRPKPPHRTLTTAMQIGWDEYVGDLVRAARPSHIVCVGVGVFNALVDRLAQLPAAIKVVPQPNARLTAADHEISYRTYRSVVREANAIA